MKYVFGGARTFLSAAACELEDGFDSPPRWNISRCCGQECPRSAKQVQGFQPCGALRIRGALEMPQPCRLEIGDTAQRGQAATRTVSCHKKKAKLTRDNQGCHGFAGWHPLEEVQKR